MPLPSTSPISLPAIAPGAAPASPASPAGDDTPFAKLLSKQQDTADAAGDADTAEADQLPAAKRSGVRVGSKATPPHAGATTKSEHAAGGAKPADIEAAPDGRADKARDADARTGTPPADPALASWLAAVPRPAATACDTSATSIDGAKSLRVGVERAVGEPKAGAAAQPLVDASAAAAGAAASGRADKTTDPAKDAAATLLASADERIATPDTARLAAGDRDARDARFELPRLPETAASPAGHAQAAHAALRAEPAATPPPLAIELPTPVTAPEFHDALGVQVSVLARDGVQHAELHLNPADMGPISVQIALDGTRAQVDFGAASSATRQVIEAGLPELAAALRDAGFTLAGGGVSQHARGQSQSDGAPREGRGGTARVDAAGETAARRVTVRVPQGSVDLYA
ncbi:MAG: flagellar hook-length control protein FliK [Rhizobacter sp.]